MGRVNERLVMSLKLQSPQTLQIFAQYSSGKNVRQLEFELRAERFELVQA